MNGDDLSDCELLNLIAESDDQCLEDGADPVRRSYKVPSDVMRRIGYQGYIQSGPLSPPVLRRIRELHRALYSPNEFKNEALHLGVFVFRDVYVRFEIPIVFGAMELEPVEHLNMSPLQKKWFLGRKSDVQLFYDLYRDVFDFMHPLTALLSNGNEAMSNKVSDGASDLAWNARFHFQAAASILTSQVDHRGAVQSLILAAELVLKAGLVAHGISYTELASKYGHNLQRAANDLGDLQPRLNKDRVFDLVAKLPSLVDNRYSSSQPNRQLTGQIAMAAQAIGGEVMRTLCVRSFSDIGLNSGLHAQK